MPAEQDEAMTSELALREALEECEAELLAAQEREKALQSDEALLAFTYAYQGALGTQGERVAVARRAYERVLAGSPSEKPGSEEDGKYGDWRDNPGNYGE